MRRALEDSCGHTFQSHHQPRMSPFPHVRAIKPERDLALIIWMLRKCFYCFIFIFGCCCNNKVNITCTEPIIVLLHVSYITFSFRVQKVRHGFMCRFFGCLSMIQISMNLLVSLSMFCCAKKMVRTEFSL